MTDAPNSNPSPQPSPRKGRGSQGKDLRAVKLGRLFAEGKKRGLDANKIRNEVAPAQLGKRLSESTVIEIEWLTNYICGERIPKAAEGEPRRMSGYKQRYDDLGNRKGMATPKQLRMIEAMWHGVSKMRTYHDRLSALNSFIKRVVNVDDMRFVESWQVQKIINAISRMKRPQQ